MPRGINKLSLDAKGRISIPTKHRSDLISASQGRMVLTASPKDRCLLLYTMPVWEVVEQKIISLPTMNAESRKLKRIVIGHADDVEMDGSGRILLSADLREFANIGKKAVLVGLGDKFEIWDDASWFGFRDMAIDEGIDESALPETLNTMSF